MQFLTNEENLVPLRNALEKAEKRIWISSAWIRSATLSKVFTPQVIEKIKAREIDIRFLIRIGRIEDMKITDARGFFFFLDEKLGKGKSTVQVRYTRHLHAKLNVIDSTFATTGSFNLTGGGYGNEDFPGTNEEAGILLTDPEKVEEAARVFTDIWEKAIPLEKEIVGFTIGGGTHRRVGLVALRNVPAGAFLEISEGKLNETRENAPRKWLATLVKPIAGTRDFFHDTTPEAVTGPQSADYLEAIAEPDPMVRQARLIAAVSDKNEPRVLLGEMEIKGEITTDDSPTDGSLPFNRYAVPALCAVKFADPHYLEELFKRRESAPIGRLISNSDVPISIDFEEVLTRHFSVFGTTGSGKSYFAKQFIGKMAPWITERGGRALILDTHGEYREGKDLPENVTEIAVTIPSQTLKETLSKKLMNQMDSFRDLGIKWEPDEEQTLREALLKIKGIENEDEKIRTFISVLETQTRQPADPSYKWIDKLEDLLKEEYDAVIDSHLVKWLFEDIIKAKLDEEGLTGSSKDGKERKAVLSGQYLSVLKGKRDLYQDLRQKAMETEVGKVLKSYRASGLPAFSPEKYEKLRLLFEEKKIGFVERSIIDKIKTPGVYVVELRDLEDDEERREMVGRLLQQVFDESKRTDGGFQTLIVVEEAHNYAPEGKGGGALSARELRRIASEGRKFHVGLLVITQRPAYVSKDVLAQCNTSAVFRLVNNNDLKAIEASIEMVTQAQLDEIPAYEQGQCLITGVGVKEPVTVKIG